MHVLAIGHALVLIHDPWDMANHMYEMSCLPRKKHAKQVTTKQPTNSRTKQPTNSRTKQPTNTRTKQSINSPTKQAFHLTVQA